MEVLETLSTTSTDQPGPPRPSAAALLAEGVVAGPEALAPVREWTEPGPLGRGRVVDVRVSGGLDVEVLPDRGLDLGAAWYRGVPLSWTSPVATGAPLPVPRGEDWLARFRGGLVTTCGTDSIGPATADAGLHGRHSHLPATDVRVNRRQDADGLVVTVSGTVADVSLFGRRVVVRRTVETRTDRPLLVLRDEVENTGWSATAVPLLYHVNLGAPLVVPGTRVASGARELVAREPVAHVPDPSLLPGPLDAPTEAVHEHRDVPAEDGRARVVVTPPGGDLAVEVSWATATLPRLYQWTWPARRGWALGVEPSNAALFGAGADAPGRSAPELAPGAVLRTELVVRVLAGDGRGER